MKSLRFISLFLIAVLASCGGEKSHRGEQSPGEEGEEEFVGREQTWANHTPSGDSPVYEEFLDESDFTEDEIIDRSGRFPAGDVVEVFDSLGVPEPEEPTTSTDNGRVIGQISYNQPDSLLVGIPADIEVRLTKNLELEITAGLPAGTPTATRLEVTEFMKVELTCTNDTAMVIAPFSASGAQQVVNEGVSHWSWTVTAQTPGEKQFKIIVALGDLTDVGDRFQFSKPQEFVISTHANWPWTVRKFLSDRWEWILTVVIFPVVGFVGKKEYERRMDTTKNQ